MDQEGQTSIEILDPDSGEIRYQDDAWIEMMGTPPVYSLIIVPKLTVVDPGDTIEIEVYINGYGEIGRNKFQINIPYSSFITDDEVKGFISTSLRNLELDDGDPPNHFIQSEGIERSTAKIRERGTSTPLPPEFFSPIQDAPHGYPQLATEAAFDDVPFLSIELVTSTTAKAGDYPVFFTFTYGLDDEVSQDKAIFDVHINSFYEQNERLIAIAIISATLIALITLIVQAWNFAPF